MFDKKLMVQPLYLQLRAVLTERIASGTWRAGEALPNEVELAREFGLSAGTVRKALDWMEQARLVSREQGRGTFVVDQSSDELANRFECIRRPDGTPVAPQSADATVSEADATPQECERLRLKPGARVQRIVQKLLLNGVPLLVETASLPLTVFPRAELASGKPYNVVTLAKSCGVLLGHADEVLCMASASAETAAALGVETGTPIMVLTRVVYTLDRRPAELRIALCNLGKNHYQAAIGS